MVMQYILNTRPYQMLLHYQQLTLLQAKFLVCTYLSWTEELQRIRNTNIESYNILGEELQATEDGVAEDTTCPYAS